MTQKLLFADDSLTMHRVVAITFGQEDVTLLGARSGAEALALASQAEPDVALLDAHLADMDGYTLCARLQQARPSGRPLPVLLLVSAQHPVDDAKLAACGALGAVKKPFDTQTLVARVRAACLQGVQNAGAQAQADHAEKQGTAPSTDAAFSVATHESPPRPAFFPQPPPIPHVAPGQAETSVGQQAEAARAPAEASNQMATQPAFEPWSQSFGGPPAQTPDVLSQAPQTAGPAATRQGFDDMPRAVDLPQMPEWSMDFAQEAPEGRAGRATAAHEPLWSEKESTTAEDLRRPQIDAEVTSLARADSAKDATQATALALSRALEQLPAETRQALGPDFAQLLAPALVQAMERAVWDVLPAIVRQESMRARAQDAPQA